MTSSPSCATVEKGRHVPVTEVDAITARPWRSPNRPERVLAIRLQALGDTVLTLPYLSALRRRLPGARLDFLTRREVADIPTRLTLFDEVVELGGGRTRRWQMLGALALLPRLLAQRYDVVIDLQRSDVSRIVRMLLRPAAWSEFDRFSPRLAGERTRATIEAIGLGPLDVRPDLILGADPDSADRLHAGGWDGMSSIVVLNPAGAFPGRSWPLDSWARFAETWSKVDPDAVQFVVLGLPALGAKARYLAECLGDRLVDLSGRTSSGQAFAVIRHASLVVSEDSGLMHMAWVAGVPTLGLFGASRAGWSRPHGSYAGCVRACVRPDGACIDGRCREAPPSCLEGVSPELVVERARDVVSSGVRQRRIDPEP